MMKEGLAMRRAKRFLGTGLLCAALAFAGGCSSSEVAVDVPSFIQEPVELTKTLSVGHVSVGYPNELEGRFFDSSERAYEDGSSCIVTFGQFYNEDWSLVGTVEEYTGRSIDDALAEIEQDMALAERYEELDMATQASVRNPWVSLESTEAGFDAVRKTFDNAAIAMFRHIAIDEVSYVSVCVTLPVVWHEANPNFAAAVLDSVVLNEDAAGFPDGIWIPTEIDPVYVDDAGTTWGYWYQPEGEPDYVRVSPDMLYAQGDDGVAGYLKVAEEDAAIEASKESLPDEPGEYEVEVVSNLYGFLSDEVVSVRTSESLVTQPAETPEESANEWVPVGEAVSITSDGRTWGWWTVGGSTDMEFVMATDTGRYGYIIAAERIEAENANWVAFMNGEHNPTCKLDVYLYDSDEVVGQYAVSMHA